MSRRAVTVIGIGDDGCKGLSARAMDAIARAAWLAGGERHLAFFPEFRGERIVIKDGLVAVMERIANAALENDVVVLASGDPLFHGIGSLVVKKLGAEHVEVIPHPSSVQLAFARTGLRWDDATLLSLHGRPRTGLVTRLRRLAKVAILTDEINTPAALGQHLIDFGETGWRAWICENLGGPDERVRSFALTELPACGEVAPLNVLLLVREDIHWQPPPLLPYLPEDIFAKRMPKKGLITKREVRLLSLAALQLRSASVVWDVGAASGSVGIEAAMLCPEGRVFAIEVDPESVVICRENVRALGVDNVEIIAGRAPEALTALPDPDAVFIGGSKGSMEEIIDVAWDRLRPGGRLVVNAITLENVNEAYQALRKRDLTPEVSLVQISRAEPLASYLRWGALNPIQIFAVGKPADQADRGPA